MSTILGALFAEFWPYLAGAGVIIAGYFGIRRSAVKDERNRTALKAAEKRAQTLSEVRKHEREAETQDDVSLIDRLAGRK